MDQDRRERRTTLKTAATSIAVVAVIAVSLCGCGYGARKQDSQRVIDSVKRLEAEKTASGTIGVSLELDKVVTTTVTRAGVDPKQAHPKIGGNSVDFTLDLEHSRVAVSPKPAAASAAQAAAARAAGPGEAAGAGGLGGVGGLAAMATGGDNRLLAAGVPMVFNRGAFYLQRPPSPVDEDDQRTWYQVDFTKTAKSDEGDLVGIPLINVVNPAYLVQLVSGTLSGSVKRVGVEQVGGVSTVKYEMNLDRDKASRRLKDADQQALEHAFSSNHLTGTIYKHAAIWLDDAGLPRRIFLPLRQSVKDQKIESIFNVDITIDLGGFHQPVNVQVPSPETTNEVKSLNAVLSVVRT